MTSRKIPAFEDLDVDRATVRITNAGDGLSEALKVQPKAFHIGDECYFVLRGEVTQINHRADKDDTITRVHTVKASDITEVEGDVAEKILKAAASDLERRKAEMDGQLALDMEHAAEARERDDETAFQGRSGVHPTGGAHLNDSAGEGDDDVEAAELAERLADDQAEDDEDDTPSNVLTPSFAPPAVGH